MIILVSLLLVGAVYAQDNKELDKPKFRRAKISLQVVDQEGNPMPKLRIMAMKVGDGSQSWTDGEGKCGLNLKAGDWTIKVIRLPREELLREYLKVGDQKQVELLLTVLPEGTPVEDDRHISDEIEMLRAAGFRSETTSGDSTIQLNSEALNTSSRRAAAGLTKFTETVLQEARQKIIESANRQTFSTNFWVDEADQAQERLLGLSSNPSAESQPAFSRSTSSLLSSSYALNDVPVTVVFGVAEKNIMSNNSYNSSPTANVGSNLSYRVSNFLSGGNQAPQNISGYDFGTNTDLALQRNQTFSAFYNEVNNNIADLYRPLKDNFVSTNVSNTQQVRGVEFGVVKNFIGVNATVLYSYSEAGGLDIRTVNLQFEDWQDFEYFLENGLRHELSTTLEAGFEPTGTRFKAVYRIFPDDGLRYELDDRIDTLVTNHSRIDLKLNQKINFGILNSMRISFDLALNNIMNSVRGSIMTAPNINEGMGARKLIGGMVIEFE
jgi:hypothetical protein